jgi:protein-L-isoaspartate(D-aspartate) O-methyltransferase
MNPRERMIREITEKYNLNSPGVLFALSQIPREKFIPVRYKHLAYDDSPVSIGFGQTISQPFTVALMTHLLNLKKSKTVLEIGTGSGYSTALLSLLSKKVYSIERIKPLGEKAKKRLTKMGYKNVVIKIGQGEIGWKEFSPFEAIVVWAGIERIPKKLLGQLKERGVLVAPIGKGMDKVVTRYTKKGKKVTEKEFGIFNFVPLIEKTS